MKLEKDLSKYLIIANLYCMSAYGCAMGMVHHEAFWVIVDIGAFIAAIFVDTTSFLKCMGFALIWLPMFCIFSLILNH